MKKLFKMISLRKVTCYLLIFAMIFSILSTKDMVSAYASSSKGNGNSTADIYITTTNKNGNKIEKADDYVSVKSIKIYDADGNLDVSSVNQGDQMKVRGNSSALGAKKPFNIKFSSKTSVLGMDKNKKWCLIANCYDPTLLRNYIAFQISQDMGLTTPNYQMVELTVDGVYKGCYLLTEPTEKAADIDTDKGEFFIEYEKERSESETTYFKAGTLRFCADDPEYDDFQDSSLTYNGKPYKTYIQSTLNSLIKVLNSNDYEKVKKNFDVDSLARYYVLNELYKTLDFGYSSVNYVYKDGKLAAGPVWDYDRSTGNVNSKIHPWYFDSKGNSYTKLRCKKQLYTYLCNYSQFNELITKYYSQYQSTFVKYYKSGGYIDQAVAKYKSAINLNYTSVKKGGAGWVVSKQYWKAYKKPLSTYAKNLSFYKKWLKQRNNYLSTKIYKLTKKKYKLSKTKYTYNGAEKNPSLKITDVNGKTISSSNYTITKTAGRTDVGTYTYKVTFTGDYASAGTYKVKFTIVPKGTSISSVVSAAKSFTVKWKKQDTQTTGYQIAYSTNAKFTKAKTVKVKDPSKISYKVSKLSAKKKYYVRIRTYTTVNGKNYYSSWSAKKAVTTK